jgi:hypothetical protein
MIDLKIFENKRDFTKINGDTVVDLTRRSVSFKGVKIGQGKSYLVEDGIEMRADLLSKAFYQTSGLLCLLLKYNGISNPFSLNVGDLIKIPDDGVLLSMVSNPEKLNGSGGNWQTSTRKKKSSAAINPKTKQDETRINYLQSTSSTQIAPTNVARDKSVKIVNGRIVFGTDVTSIKKDDCPDPISRTKLQAALLKNKLIN